VKFEVVYPTGARHEVELQGTLAILGRDPSCDLVLTDVKCSRRHAVVEAGPDGLSIRDTGSANGVFVNGRRVERSRLSDGDLVKLGGVEIRILPEEISGTLVMGPDEIDDITLRRADVPRPSADRGLPRAPASPPAPLAPPPAEPQLAPPLRRPVGLAILALVWMVSSPVALLVAVGLAFAAGRRGPTASVALTLGVLALVLGPVVGAGLWRNASWARNLAIVLGVVGLCSPFLIAAAAAVVYLLAGARRSFSDGTETAFGSTVALGALVGFVGAGAIGAYSLDPRGTPDVAALEAAAIERLRRLATAEDEFRKSTCNEGYAEVEGLVAPATVIPDFRPGRPGFLPPHFASRESEGYRYDLEVADPLPRREGCPSPTYRRFRYAASPLSPHLRHFAIAGDRVVRAARGRPAQPSDPALP
jgi:hypothetical protein